MDSFFHQLLKPKYRLSILKYRNLHERCNLERIVPLHIKLCRDIRDTRENVHFRYGKFFVQSCRLLPIQKNVNSCSLYGSSCFHTSSNFGTKEDNTKGKVDEESQTEKPEKLSLFQRFKKMYKDYWYVLLPVHVVTSIGWFGGFYYLAQSGLDIVAILEYVNISEKLINPLRDSKAGYVAVSYALYKIATPLRYTVTLGGTTVSINYLKKWGYIKPMPSREKLKEMYEEKKEELIQKKDQFIEDKKEQIFGRKKD